MKIFNFQGKTEKEKAKDKSKSGDKNKFKDKMPKILKAGESGGKGKKKVILNSKNKCFFFKYS